jgi:hypothetical protein
MRNRTSPLLAALAFGRGQGGVAENMLKVCFRELSIDGVDGPDGIDVADWSF